MMEPTSVDRTWAKSLTNTRMAADLDQLATNVRFHTASQRAALLLEAAERIRRAPR